MAAIRSVRRVFPFAREVTLVGYNYVAGGKVVIAWDDEVGRSVHVTHGQRRPGGVDTCAVVAALEIASSL